MVKKWMAQIYQFFSYPRQNVVQSMDHIRIIKKGFAMRVMFFYPGEEGTYVDHAEVELYENGMVHIRADQEETTTHLQNCEILWSYPSCAEDRVAKVRLLKPKLDKRTPEDITSREELSSSDEK